MISNPALGVFFHWLGGLASASFYVPYRGVKSWAWETYWLVGGFFSWIIAPWILALTMTHCPWQMAVVGLPDSYMALTKARQGRSMRSASGFQQPPGSRTAS